MQTPNRFKVAAIQHPPVFLNMAASLEKARTLAEQAAVNGAEVIVFPETWLPGYPVWLDFAPNAGLWDHPPAKQLYRLLVENSLSLPGPDLAELLCLAKDVRACIVMVAHELVRATLYNTMLFLHKNGVDFEVHRKLMPTYTERLIWGMGDGSTLSALDIEYGRLGGLICWEHWMPLARATMHAKQETLHVAQWPMVKEMNLVASRHYAFEGQCFVVAAGCVLSKGDILSGFKSLGQRDNEGIHLLESIPGEDDDLILEGGSAIIAPNGDCLAGPIYDEASIIYADIEPARITEGRLFLDTDGHYSRPDIFRLEVNSQPLMSI
ncbi:carbon-nitrogen hydrolase family protein [candidate division KSB1 bacterium]|nr:carbon-nitrogen hydrolase family protein [candidate division KSB1 bacterium]